MILVVPASTVCAACRMDCAVCRIVVTPEAGVRYTAPTKSNGEQI
jgi:hypothetical protein